MPESTYFMNEVNEDRKINDHVKKLKANSDKYPKIRETTFMGQTFLDSTVRLISGNVYYLVHIHESGAVGVSITKPDLYKRFAETVYKIQVLLEINNDVIRKGVVSVDPDQTSETARIKKVYKIK